MNQLIFHQTIPFLAKLVTTRMCISRLLTNVPDNGCQPPKKTSISNIKKKKQYFFNKNKLTHQNVINFHVTR